MASAASVLASPALTPPAVDTHLLACTGCGATARPGTLTGDLRCPCGELYAVEYPELAAADGPALAKTWRARRLSSHPLDQSGVWRFRELLPILADPAQAVTLREGNTPLYHLPRAARALGHDELFAKHQGLNPTGSFKDTGMTAALSVAHEAGFTTVACASTGNTSAAMAAYAARAGMRALVLIPQGKIAWGKLSQAMDYGAETFQLRTDFDGCVRVLAELVRRAPVFLLNSVNPYRLEGQKTPAFELAEAMDWQVPDHVVVPGGNLANISALGKGFAELRAIGLTRRLPRLHVIQAEGANPLYRMVRSGAATLAPVHAHTRASAIQIGSPASWRKAVRVLAETDGVCEQASEAEIALAKAELGREGLGAEPASAAALAGFKKLQASGVIRKGESAVLFLTGHTLKDSDYTIEYHRGTLLSDEEAGPLAVAIKGSRRPSVELDATPEAVLAALERRASA